MWGCKMDSAGCASFWIQPRTCGFHEINNISDYLSDYQLCKDSVPWNFSFNHVQACECLYPATTCTFYSSPRAKPRVLSHLYQIFGIISHWYPGHHLDKFLQINQHTTHVSLLCSNYFHHLTYQLTAWKQTSYLGHQATYPTQRIYLLKTKLNPTNKYLGPSMISGRMETLEIWLTASGSQTVWIPND
jgi:hypothetical protein